MKKWGAILSIGTAVLYVTMIVVSTKYLPKSLIANESSTFVRIAQILGVIILPGLFILGIALLVIGIIISIYKKFKKPKILTPQ